CLSPLLCLYWIVWRWLPDRLMQVVNKFFKSALAKLLGQAPSAMSPEALTELLVAFVPHLEPKNLEYLYKALRPHLQLVRPSVRPCSPPPSLPFPSLPSLSSHHHHHHHFSCFSHSSLTCCL